MNKNEIIREYLSKIGKKGGKVTGPCKARKLSRAHYAKVSAGQRERWRLWHIEQRKLARENLIKNH